MNKKAYIKPEQRIVRIHQAQMLCASPVTTVSSNLTGDDAIDYGGGGNGPARARQYSGTDWDDEW